MTRVCLRSLLAVALSAASICPSAHADYTTVLTSGEPSVASIFNSAYGTSVSMAQINSAGFTSNGYSFSRVSDFAGATGNGVGPTNLHNAYTNSAGSTTDATFRDGTAYVQFTVKYAGYNNGFGWSNQSGAVNSGNYQQILAPSAPGTSSDPVLLSSNFQFALRVNQGGQYWGTNERSRSGRDHFATWFVSGHGRQFWVLAVEDLDLGDRDYNDWVGEVQVVQLIPLPTGLTAGLAGLGVLYTGIRLRARAHRQNLI